MPEGNLIDIRPVTAPEIDQASGVLARAFEQNPAFLALLDYMDAESRPRAVHHIERAFVDSAVHGFHAHALHENGKMIAVALVCAPGQYPFSFSSMMRMSKGIVRVGPRAALRFLLADGRMNDMHLKRPHYYLFVLGVEPSEQGKGHGKAMLAHIHPPADAEDLPFYLETDRKENIPFYETAGYELTAEHYFPKLGGLRFWCMVRQPRHGGR